MNTNDDLVPITKFIAESEKNIEIATAIYEQYEQARSIIVREFLSRLTIDLKMKLPEWSSEYDTEFFLNAYGTFWLHKTSWRNRYAIMLESYDWGDRMIYGVWRNESLLKLVPRNAELLGAVRTKLPQAASRKYYEAEIKMSSPAIDWRKPNALWRMQSDETFRAEVVALLLEVVQLTEKNIDDMVKVLPSSIAP